MRFETKVYKMGNKLGIFLKSAIRRKFDFRKGDFIKVIVTNNEKETEFLTKFNYNIILRKAIIKELKLEPNDILKVKIGKVINLERSTRIFKENKIDLLSLIPKKTFLGYEIFVDKFRKNGEEWLRIWYCHCRGSGRQIELKRYINITSFGSLLGQLQAEGSKFSQKRKHRVEFSNKLIEEHSDFLRYLFEMGINSNLIEFLCVFNPNRFDENKINKKIDQFSRKFNITNVKTKAKGSRKIWCSFRTTIRRSVLSEILLTSMHKMRKLIVKRHLKSQLVLFVNAFISKLLTGDGTIDISKRKVPTVSIKITDQNLRYLQDYAEIMKAVGFKGVHVNPDYIYVRSSCSFDNLLYLYQIEAFKDTINWNKLLVAIGLCLQGRRLKTKIRFLELEKLEVFTSLDIRDKYKVCLRSANDWITNNIKSGYIELVNKDTVPYKYQLTKKAKELNKILGKWREDLRELIKIRKIENLSKLLNSLKVKSF